MDDELEQAISENASSPKKASADSVSVEQHSLIDQIAADKYLASKNAVKSKGGGINIKKMSSPGAV